MKRIIALQLLLALAPAFPSAAAERPLRPEAEVTASSGPVRLTLRVYKKRISMREGFWYQLELKNIGKQSFVIWDRVFWEPGWQQLEARVQRVGSTYIEALAPDGAIMDIPLPSHGMPGCEPEVWPPPPYVKRTTETVALSQRWRKEGLSENDIMDRLHKRQSDINYREYEANRPRQELKPGDSIVTPPFAHNGYSNLARRTVCDKQPVGQFAEFDYFEWERPGRYRVRAVYNHDLGEYSDPRFISERKIRTPWVQLEVSR